MYVCVCISVSGPIYVYIYIYVHTCMYMYMCMCMCMYTYICFCLCLCSICMCMYMYTRIYLYTHICLCIHISVYVDSMKLIYVCVCDYTLTYTSSLGFIKTWIAMQGHWTISRHARLSARLVIAELRQPTAARNWPLSRFFRRRAACMYMYIIDICKLDREGESQPLFRLHGDPGPQGSNEARNWGAM